MIETPSVHLTPPYTHTHVLIHKTHCQTSTTAMESITCLSFSLKFLSWSDSPQLWILHREPILCFGSCHSAGPLSPWLSPFGAIIRLCLSLPTPGWRNARILQHPVSSTFTKQHSLYEYMFCISYFPHWCHQRPDKKHLDEGRICLGLWFKGTQSIAVGKTCQQAAPAGIWDFLPHWTWRSMTQRQDKKWGWAINHTLECYKPIISASYVPCP